MTSSWLSRVRLRRDAPAAALAPVLLPSDPAARVGTAHRLLWTLFGDAPERARDFLWREEGSSDVRPGRASFLLLSARPPEDTHRLFEPIEPKLFAPVLASGDRLIFSLRANPVITRRNPKTGKAERHDIVMDRLRQVPQGERAGQRLAATLEAGTAWLEAQGQRHGFHLKAAENLRIDGYDQVTLRREGKTRPLAFSVLDLDGMLEVRDPDAFGAALLQGFGKAKAFGCGLMLIRRA